MGTTPLTGAAIKTAFSLIHDHLLKTGHSSNLDDFHILYKPHDPSLLPLWEYIYFRNIELI